MKIDTESIYLRLPYFLQNILVSVYGFKLYRERFNDSAQRFEEILERTRRYSTRRVQQYQNRSFRLLVKHALETVPFYMEYAKANNLSPLDFSTVEDVRKLPIIEKADLQGDPEKFISGNYKFNELIRLQTSGSTGTPLTVYCDGNARTFHYAFFSRLRASLGIIPGSKRATLFGRIIMSPGTDAPPFWRYDFFQKNLLMSSYHLSEKNMPYYYNKLASYKPDEIIGYPSSIFLLAKYMVKNGRPKIEAKAIITTGESLLSNQRACIALAFNAPIVDQYGCTEMAFFIAQCEKGRYHIHPEHGFMETLDVHDVQTGPGVIGSVVATSLVNYGMPLVRYRLTDQVSYSDARCDCGANFLTINQPHGRLDDILILPDGKPLGRLSQLVKGLDKYIVESQIIQRDTDELLIRVVASQQWTQEIENEFRHRVWLRTGSSVKVLLEFCDEIPKFRNGKFRSVISLVNSELG